MTHVLHFQHIRIIFRKYSKMLFNDMTHVLLFQHIRIIFRKYSDIIQKFSELKNEFATFFTFSTNYFNKQYQIHVFNKFHSYYFLRFIQILNILL